MGLATLDGLYVTLLFIMPGWLAGFPMKYVTGLPPAEGTIEPLLRALARSVGGYVFVELVALPFTRGEFGAFVLTPLLSGEVAELGEVSLTWQYGLATAVVIALPTVARSIGQKPAVERRLRLRTAEQASLHRMRRYMVTPAEDCPPYVRIETSNGSVEGWLRWSADGVEKDQALIVQAYGVEDVTWIPVSSIVSFTAVASGPEGFQSGDRPPEVVD